MSAVVLAVLGGVSAASTDAASATGQGVSARTSVAHTRAVVRHRAAAKPGSELAAVTKAVHRSEFVEGIPTTAYRVVGLRTAGDWGRTTLVPTDKNQLDPAVVLVHKVKGAWTVADLGTAEVGCEVAPAATLKALQLTCP